MCGGRLQVCLDIDLIRVGGLDDRRRRAAHRGLEGVTDRAPGAPRAWQADRHGHLAPTPTVVRVDATGTRRDTRPSDIRTYGHTAPNCAGALCTFGAHVVWSSGIGHA